MNLFQPTFHRDNTVTFWSVYQQVWLRFRADKISDRELAAMSDNERRRVEKAIERLRK